MRGEVRRHVTAARHPLQLADLLERRGHAARGKTGVDQIAHAELVGVLLVLARVLELHGLGAGHGAHDHGVGRVAPALGTDENGRKDAQQRTGADQLALLDGLGDVALGHMGQFVGNDTGQFVFAGHVGDQPGENRDVAGGRGESVQGPVSDHRYFDGKGLRRHRRHKTVHNGLHVARDARVIDDGEPCFDDQVELARKFDFVADGEFAKSGLNAPGTGQGHEAGQEPHHPLCAQAGLHLCKLRGSRSTAPARLKPLARNLLTGPVFSSTARRAACSADSAPSRSSRRRRKYSRNMSSTWA